MPKCPNCEQPTARTTDWACQWCGHPLISKSYKELPQSYKELKEEKRHKDEQLAIDEPEASLLSPADAPESETQPMTEPEPEPIPESEPQPMSQPEVMPEPEAELTLETEPEPIPEPEPQPEAVSAAGGLTVEQLYSEYTANAVDADAKYKGETLKITGTVYKVVVNNTLDIRYVTLTSTKKHEKWNVRCTFDKQHESELNKLTTEQRVTVEGKYDGYRTNIIIRDCVLVY